MLLALLPSHTSGKTQAAYNAAEHSGAGLPMLLSVHVEQQLDGRAYLWTSSNLVLPGESHKQHDHGEHRATTIRVMAVE